VRSDRLMAVLLLLQQPEQVPAAEVAREPEVYRGRRRATTSTRQARRTHTAPISPSRCPPVPAEELRALTWSNVNLDGEPAPTSRSCRTCGYGGRSGRWRDQDPVLAANPSP